MSRSGLFLHTLSRLVFGLVILFPVLSRADGGSIRFQGDTGPFHITVFTSPPVLTAGTVDVTVLAQDRTSLDPLLDATVTFNLVAQSTAKDQVDSWTPPACASTMRSSLTNIPAKLYHGENRLLYGAYVRFPHSGTWKLNVKIEHAAASGNVSLLLPVDPPIPPPLAYWHLLILPALGILGFIANRSAKRGHRKVSRLQGRTPRIIPPCG